MPLKNYFFEQLSFINNNIDGIKNKANSKIAILTLPKSRSIVPYKAVPKTILNF